MNFDISMIDSYSFMFGSLWSLILILFYGISDHLTAIAFKILDNLREKSIQRKKQQKEKEHEDNP